MEGKKSKINVNVNVKEQSFRLKITLLIIALALIPLIASNGYLGVKNVMEVKSNVSDTQLMNTDLITGQSNAVLEKIQGVVNIVANSESVQSMDFDKADAYVKEMLKENSILSDVGIVGPNGMQVYNSLGKDKLGDRSDRDYFKAGMNGQAGFSDVLVSKSTNKPIVVCYAPIKKDNKVIGVLNANMSLDKFSDIVTDAMKGHDGQAYIVDKTGKVIAHKDKTLVEKMSDYSKLLPVQNVIKKQQGTVEYDNNGTKLLASYIPIDIANWGLVVEMDSAAANKGVTSLIWTIVSIVFFILLLAIYVSYKLAQYITNPLVNIKKKISLAAGGNLKDAPIDGKILERNDEFGQIAKGFNEMVDSISGLIKEIKDSNDVIVSSSDALSKTTAQVATATDEVANAVEEISKTAEDQARQTESGAAKVNELAENIELVGTATTEMKNISVNAQTTSDKGLQTVDVLIEKTKENNKATKEVSLTIDDVNDSANKIGAIIEAIGQIAEQTNLLALNAAIEAARAGEAGKGFAVVAEEVRTLSEQSSESANEISALIYEVQRQAKTAVDMMRSAEKVVSEQNEAVKETGELFKKISSLIQELTSKMNEIDRYSNIMDSRKDEIVNVITNIAAASEESAASTQEVAASTEEQLSAMEEIEANTNSLSSLAKKLEEAIDKFNI
ncbi:methyl-accepting chemotaxis protein [Clostridium sp. YIM B02551]|uniref:methyl-accepting chemotaxis protein n=1 Tax=Clostridium sp. YIM B02551 TaxID=2910679 RepID=UPI001EEC3F79|nr:methyl-accepting chemotaxis protein [Clostridium sp. YIM B02551]